MESVFMPFFQYLWIGVGVFIAIVIMIAVVVFFYETIKDFSKYIFKKLFKRGNH